MAAATNFDIKIKCADTDSSKPLSDTNETKSLAARCTSSKPSVMTPNRAKARFSERVSNGISVLIERHGYSRERASDLILKEISRGGEPPSEDEIFAVMKDVCVGMYDALKALTVAKALRRVEKERGLSSSDAIEYLSSCLTVMKLLGKVESQQAEIHSNNKDSLPCQKDEQVEMRGSAQSSSMQISSTQNASTQNSNFKPSSLNGSKSKLSRKSLPAATSRKRPIVDTNGKHSTCSNNCDDVINVKVARLDMEQSHLNKDSSLSRSKTSQPRNKRANDSSGNNDDEGQPHSSRPRLDSMGIS